MFKRLSIWFTSIGCPNFYEDFPKENTIDDWVAVVIRTNPFGGRREIYKKVMKNSGLYDVYVEARKLAFKLDCETPYADGELGVEWGIRKFNKDEDKSN